ncbi:unnamed protein product, partial [Rotaria sp. Silwood2]
PAETTTGTCNIDCCCIGAADVNVAAVDDDEAVVVC